MMKLLQQLVFFVIVVLSVAFLPTSASAKPPHHAHTKAKPAKVDAPAKADQAAAPTPAAAVPHAVVGNEPVPPPPSLDAKSWLLMDYTTGQTLAESNADARVEPASITKVMTAYIVSAELAKGKIKLDDGVFISENAWRSGGASTEG